MFSGFRSSTLRFQTLARSGVPLSEVPQGVEERVESRAVDARLIDRGLHGRAVLWHDEALLELHVDIGKGLADALAERDQPVIGTEGEQYDNDDDAENDDELYDDDEDSLLVYQVSKKPPDVFNYV